MLYDAKDIWIEYLLSEGVEAEHYLGFIREDASLVRALRKELLDLKTANKKRARDGLESYMHDKRCMFCDYSFYELLVPHHINPKEKEHNISTMVKEGLPWEEVLTELNKCALICQNCHWMIHRYGRIYV